MLLKRLLDTNSAICQVVVKRNVPYVIIDREIVHTDQEAQISRYVNQVVIIAFHRKKNVKPLFTKRNQLHDYWTLTSLLKGLDEISITQKDGSSMNQCGKHITKQTWN